MLFLLLSFTGSVSAGYSQDSGVVSNVFVTPSGLIALKLDQGFPNAQTSNQCPGNNGWAGHKSADPILKSAILMAKASGGQISVIVEGCEGAWFKIKDIYLN